MSRRPLVALAVVCAAAAWLYGRRLDQVPAYLHHDEVLVALQAKAVADTGRDANGRFLPVYFQVDTSIHWYPPVIVYVTAAVLKVLPLSDWSVRVPNMLIGVLGVALMFPVARRMFGDGPALAAAALLAVTPAYVMHSRVVTDSLFPVVFILGWLWAWLDYLERPSCPRLLVATGLLGFGMYTYVGSIVMMPIYLLLTLGVLAWDGAPVRTQVGAVLGFSWPLLFGAAFLLAHPEMFGHYVAKYRLAPGGPQLNVLQQLKEAFTFWNVSDHLNAFHNAFAWGYLFVTGARTWRIRPGRWACFWRRWPCSWRLACTTRSRARAVRRPSSPPASSRRLLPPCSSGKTTR